MKETALALNVLFLGAVIVYGVAALFTYNIELGLLLVSFPVISLALTIIGRNK